MRIAKFKGVDGFNRPTFRRKNDQKKWVYYCTVNYLIGYDEKPDIERVNEEGLTHKGFTFEGEPSYSSPNTRAIL